MTLLYSYSFADVHIDVWRDVSSGNTYKYATQNDDISVSIPQQYFKTGTYQHMPGEL